MGAAETQMHVAIVGSGPSGKKRIVFHFCKSPVEIAGTERVRSLVFERNILSGSVFQKSARGTRNFGSIDCGLVFRSIGYRGRSLPGVPFDEQRCVIPNRDGRVSGCEGLYVTGWIKRGPSGLIGTNRADSVATVNALLADATTLTREQKPGPQGREAPQVARGTAQTNSCFKITTTDPCLGSIQAHLGRQPLD